MLTLLGYALLAIVLAGVLFLLASYFLPAGEQIAPVIRDEPLWELPPDRALHAHDVAVVRLPVALRGYRFAETDLLLDRLADELRARDEELARLRGVRPTPRPAAEAPTEPPLEDDADNADDADNMQDVPDADADADLEPETGTETDVEPEHES